MRSSASRLLKAAAVRRISTVSKAVSASALQREWGVRRQCAAAAAALGMAAASVLPLLCGQHSAAMAAVNR